MASISAKDKKEAYGIGNLYCANWGHFLHSAFVKLKNTTALVHSGVFLLVPKSNWSYIMEKKDKNVLFSLDKTYNPKSVISDYALECEEIKRNKVKSKSNFLFKLWYQWCLDSNYIHNGYNIVKLLWSRLQAYKLYKKLEKIWNYCYRKKDFNNTLLNMKDMFFWCVHFKLLDDIIDNGFLNKIKFANNYYTNVNDIIKYKLFKNIFLKK